MKILFIGKFKNTWDELGIAEMLSVLGHDVIQAEEMEERLYIPVLARELPDIVLFTKLRIGLPKEFLQACEEFGIPTVSWTFDLYWDYVREKSIPKYQFLKADYVFTTDGGHDERWESIGVKHTLLRQGIYDPENYMLDLPKEHDVVFVGTDNPNYPYRKQMVKAVGAEWFGKQEIIRGPDLNKLYASSKIVVGDSVPSPRYWSNRIYETVGRGGFVIHPRIEGLNDEFKEGTHIACYTHGDLDELKEKIAYYLKHEDEREKIRKAGFEHCRANYKLSQRVRTLCEKLESLGIGTNG